MVGRVLSVLAAGALAVASVLPWRTFDGVSAILRSYGATDLKSAFDAASVETLWQARPAAAALLAGAAALALGAAAVAGRARVAALAVASLTAAAGLVVALTGDQAVFGNVPGTDFTGFFDADTRAALPIVLTGVGVGALTLAAALAYAARAAAGSAGVRPQASAMSS